MILVMAEKDGRFSTKIRKRLRKLFFAEPHQTTLVNELLEEYYGKRKR